MWYRSSGQVTPRIQRSPSASIAIQHSGAIVSAPRVLAGRRGRPAGQPSKIHAISSLSGPIMYITDL